MENWHLLALTVIGVVFLVAPEVSSSTSDCSCYVSGDPHYYLFDNQAIHFMGSCKYILSTNKPGSNLTYFAVEVKNEHRGNTRVSYTRMVDLKLKGVTIRLLPDDKILVNSIKMNLPIVNYFGFSAHYSAGAITVKTKWGLVLKFDGVHLVHLILPGNFANQLTGICGDCNGIKDDFRTKAGEDVSGRGNKYTLIGDSYQVCDDSDKPEKCVAEQPENNCSPTQVKSCNILNSNLFKPCVDKIGQQKLKRHLDSCKFDVCAYLKQPELQSVLCKTLESMSTECEDAGVFINWRKTAKCEMKCPLNQVYSHKTPDCQPTCVNQTPACSKYTEGCICKSGYILSGEECVPKSECGCMDGKIYMMINEERYGPKCKRKSVCNSTGHLISTELNGCPENSECRIYRNKEWCYCDPGYFMDNDKCVKFVCNKPVKVQFLLESSAIGALNFEKTKTFVSGFLDFFTMNLYSVRVSIYTYWRNSARFQLTNSDDPGQVMENLKTLRYSNQSSTSLYSMLYYVNAYKNKKSTTNHVNQHSPLVIFVGSKLYYESQTKYIVNILNKAGFNIYMVGVGVNVDKTQLQNIIGKTNTTDLIFAKSFYELNTIKTQLLKKTCSVDPCQGKVNPCKNGGKCINTESSFICECTGNYFGRLCAQEKQCSCYNYGVFYYRLFDGQAIRFKGDSKYNMVSGASNGTRFSVDVKSERRSVVNSYHPTKRSVEIKINSTTIRLLPLNRIVVNEEEFTLPVVKYDEFEAYFAVGWIIVTTKWGLTVKYDGDHRVTVTLPISFANKLTGICGDCNGIQDDFRTKSGRNVSSLTDKDSLIANSYHVATDSNEWSNTTSIFNIECNSTEAERCNIIHSSVFKLCVQILGQKLTNQFFESCQSDVCSSKVSQHTDILFCKSIEAFVTECERVDVPINWRGIAGCPKLCPYLEHYTYYASSCRNDCLNTTSCSTSTEGCTCRNPLVYSGKYCSKRKYDCGCIFNDTYMMKGSRLLGSTCNDTYYCYATGKYKKYSYSCSKNGKCNLKDGKRQCVCNKGYYGSGCHYKPGRRHFVDVWKAELNAVAFASYVMHHYQCYVICSNNKHCKAYGYDSFRRICDIYTVDASGNFTLTLTDCKSKYYSQRNSNDKIVINGASLNTCNDLQVIPNVSNKEDCQDTCLRKGCYGITFSKSKKICKMLMSYTPHFVLIGNEDSDFVGFQHA